MYGRRDDMYDIFYIYPDEIVKQYKVIGNLDSKSTFQECLLINGCTPVAIVLNDGITVLNTEEPLQTLVRCYIIKQENLLGLLSISEIIDRYR